MKFFPLLRTCLRALVRNPMRATLTILGIVIGIAAVIAMMEIGAGSQEQIKKTITAMGADTLTIRASYTRTGGISSGTGGKASLLPSDAQAVLQDAPSVINTAIVINGSGQAVYGNINWSPGQIMGVTPEYLQIRDWDKLQEGYAFSEEDIIYARRVCLVGNTIVKELFDGQSPIGKTLRLKGISLTVIGVLAPKGSNMMGRDQDDVIIAPWTTIKYRISGGGSPSSSGGGSSATTSSTTSSTSSLYPTSSIAYYPEEKTSTTNSPHPRRFLNIDQILVQIADPNNSSQAVDEITEILRARHRLEEDVEDDFRIWDMAELTRAMSSTTTVMTNLLLIVAMISLVVGGVGIMNIMLVSVTERTREIGLRMAVGARPKDIMRQFLLESILLCLVGGIFGILLGRGISIGVGHFLHWPTASSPSAMALAFAVSATIGIIFGWYPSWKASNLDPIEALRHE